MKNGSPTWGAVFVIGCSLAAALLLVGVDHLLDHLTAYGASLTGGEVAIVALLKVYADLAGCFHFESVEGLSALLCCDAFHF